ncbi:MAG: Fe-S cluster assembly protein SufD [Streptococcaceae bacterium]|jgi:Fe-S cluster assembly protein SufD|nr:Fe-S cluster assembly protein SufD [Streptococcaceae bacterium]
MKEEIRSFSLIKDEPAFMQAIRLGAAENIETLDFPVIERVNYQNWNLFQNNLEEEESFAGVPDFTEIETDSAIIVQMNGQTVFTQVPQTLLEAGVVVEDLFEAMTSHPELLEKYYLKKAVLADEDKMTAHHASFMNSGILVYVPENVHLTEPISAVFRQNSDSDEAFNKHVLIVGGANSSFSYLEKFDSYGENTKQSSANIMVEVILETGSQLKYAAIDHLGEKVTTFMNRRGWIGKDAHVDWNIATMNDGNIVYDLDSDLIGDGSQAIMKVVAISYKDQIQGIDTRVTNIGNHSVGHILQHGVILDRAALTFNGIGHILKGAKGADAQQESRVLMLSDLARGDANPILLIDENEVTAGHAASIGRVDPDEMYYLMSRGIDEVVARKLVIRGFLGNVITAIPSRSVQEEFINMIEGKLANV